MLLPAHGISLNIITGFVLRIFNRWDGLLSYTNRIYCSVNFPCQSFM